MKFIISRTSGGEGSPHKDAKAVDVRWVRDTRTFKDKEEWLKRFPRDVAEAFEWGVTKAGNPYRVLLHPQTVWVIGVKNIVDFVTENGQVVISPPTERYIGLEKVPQLEIYDDYRE